MINLKRCKCGRKTLVIMLEDRKNSLLVFHVLLQLAHGSSAEKEEKKYRKAQAKITT